MLQVQETDPNKIMAPRRWQTPWPAGEDAGAHNGGSQPSSAKVATQPGDLSEAQCFGTNAVAGATASASAQLPASTLPRASSDETGVYAAPTAVATSRPLFLRSPPLHKAPARSETAPSTPPSQVIGRVKTPGAPLQGAFRPSLEEWEIAAMQHGGSSDWGESDHEL